MPRSDGVVKFKNRKRVFLAEPCTRVTRSKKTITKPVPSVDQAAELSGTCEECTQTAIEDDGLALPDDNARTTDNTERHNHMDNEDDSAQPCDENKNATMAAGDHDLTDPTNQMTAAGGQQGI